MQNSSLLSRSTSPARQNFPPQQRISTTFSKVSPFDAITIPEPPTSPSTNDLERHESSNEQNGETLHPSLVEISKESSIEAPVIQGNKRRLEESAASPPLDGTTSAPRYDIQTKRAANRRAQAASRERKRQRVELLEAQVGAIPSLQEQLSKNNKRIQELEREKLEWEREKAMWRMRHGCPCSQEDQES